MKLAGSIYQFNQNFLDHLAPLCSLLNIPLILTEKNLEETAKKYYPNVETILHDDYISYCKFLTDNYDIILSCQFLYSDIGTQALFQMTGKPVTFVWMPHGNSDKGWICNTFKVLDQEKITLVYGDKMLDAFHKQGVLDKIQNKLILGSFRHHFFLKNKDFYKKIIETEIKNKLDPKRKTILYAPTWDDSEQNSSYANSIESLLKKLPEDFNLIVKPHPNTYIKFNAELERLHDLYLNHPNILFIRNFSPIYALADFCDIYLGDMSSVGYDFLTFDKPMFFLNNTLRNKEKDPGLYLLRCGTEIQPHQYQNAYEIIKNKLETDQKDFSSIRKQVHAYTFGKVPDFNVLKEEIKNRSKN